jgi:exodeoxyribonuclease VII large subunit
MFDRPAVPPPRRALTVSEALQRANRALEERPGDVWVEGEVSTLHHSGAGHLFFSLKDERASLPVAMWRSSLQRLRFRVEVGQRLLVFGRMGVYPQQGKFQLYAERAEPAGVGELMLQLEQLKQRLSAEGLLDPARKRGLPPWPRVVGVVTSLHGAALRDILKVIRRRCPVRVLISAASVQGDGAPAELRAALRRLEAVAEVDVIIVGRGGGSLEDLWAFNNEGLARTIASCRVPVVSAVGHEVDVTIADLVADVRAATPSQAGELVVPDLRAGLRSLDGLERRMRLLWARRLLDERRRLDEARWSVERAGRAILGAQRRRWHEATRRLEGRGRRLVAAEQGRLARAQARLSAQHPRARLARDRKRLEVAFLALARAGPRLVADARLRLGRAAGKLDALSPLGVLERGYAVVTAPDGKVLTHAEAVTVGDTVEIRLHRGRLRGRVEGRSQEVKKPR